MEKIGLCVLLAICPCTTAFTAENSSTTQATFSPTSSTTVTKNITTSPTTVRPMSEPGDTCERRHSSCGDCVKEMKCYWCGGDDTCKRYPAAKVIPRDCEGNDWFWKQCVIPGKNHNCKVGFFLLGILKRRVYIDLSSCIIFTVTVRGLFFFGTKRPFFSSVLSYQAIE